MIATLLGIGRKFLPHLVVFAAVAGGVLYYGHTRYNAGEASIQVKWDKAVVEAEAAARIKEDEQDAIAKELQDELTKKGGRLDAAESRARGLAGRLRDYQSRRCLSPPATAPGEPAGAPGEPGDGPEAGRSAGDGPEAGQGVDAALEDHLAACGRDAEHLRGWQDWHKGVNDRNR